MGKYSTIKILKPFIPLVLLAFSLAACSIIHRKTPVMLFAGKPVFREDIIEVEKSIKGSALEGMDPKYAYVLLVGYQIERHGRFDGDFKKAEREFEEFLVERTGKADNPYTIRDIIEKRKTLIKDTLEFLLAKYRVKLK